MFILRFDMRAPETGAPIADLYRAALDMAEWAEGRGLAQIVVSEHHAAEDGYLPAPLLLASALAARTKNVGLQVAALLVPLHDPIALAEEMAVLDVLSGGRVAYVCGLGYRAEEYAMFGHDMRKRGRRMDACLDAMLHAWTGEPFEYEGRAVRVTPRPTTPGGPPLFIGGYIRAAMRRAARLGLSVLTQGGNPGMRELYEEACREAGTTPGAFIDPPPGTVTTGFVAEDVDEAWQQIGPYLLHDATVYAEWMGGANSVTKSVAPSVDDLRAEGGPYRIFTPDEAVDYVRSNGLLITQPLCGGLPPEFGWRSLKLLVERVLPAVKTG
jgi:alkanesulfonate monooxygenase SsuD/methylene tetrahydromethanopterin reductase-like flavin-dependent oxidoreductase (luciferase family)